MKKLTMVIALLALSASAWGGNDLNDDPSFVDASDLKIRKASVRFDSEYQLLVFRLALEGKAGATVPTAHGSLDGAPVLGYAFPTTLSPSDVGFGDVEGTLALAVTSHPDFDDTPLWDENLDRVYDNDGAVYHSHWVVLNEDQRVPGGLSVKQFRKGDPSVVLPPTNPGMPMYMDSPGFQIILRKKELLVLVPVDRVNGRTDFRFDAVAAYLQVNQSRKDRPLLGVYRVYSTASDDLSLPYSVKGAFR